MTKDYAIGIDLGTSTSEICAYTKQGQIIEIKHGETPIMPSIVAISSQGNLLVGEEALGLVDIPGTGIREVKRKIGKGEKVKLKDKEYTPEAISALILRKLKANAEEALGITIKEVVISVPANFEDPQRQATLNAAELAGLKVIRLINEPTAAALAFGIDHIDIEEQLLVFDFGGGTLDITVLEIVEGVLDVKCSFGDTQLGGKDFDEIMISLIKNKFLAKYADAQISELSLASLKSVAETTKKALSTKFSHEAYLSNFATHNSKPIDLNVEITREEFEQQISSLLERAKKCIREALNAKNIRPSALNRVLLVGGTTYIPAVRRLVQEIFGREPKADIDPDLAVGRGACISAALAQGLVQDENGIILTDVCPFGLGIEVLSEIGGQRILTYDPLIVRNTTIPYSVKKPYSLVSAEQTQVEIKLYQDQKGTAKLPSDAIDIGISGEITDIPIAPNGIPYPIEVEFFYNTNGIAQVKASIPAINKSVELRYGASDKRLNEEQMRQAKQQVQELWRNNTKARDHAPLIEKADKFLESMPPEERSPLSDIVSKLKEALANNDAEKIETLGGDLIDLMYDLENME